MRTLLACLVAFPLAAAVPAAAQNGAAAPETNADCPWSYEGATGPDHWWELCPPQHPYALCKEGKRQSPIVLAGAEPADLPRLGFDYRQTQFTVVPAYGGQELQAQAPSGAADGLYLLVGGETYRLVQFHFHTPCEHCAEPPQFPLELHLVHHNDLGEVAVVGVLVSGDGGPNAAFQAFLDTIPETGTPGGLATLDPLGLLPARRGYVRYAGSLTTPACSEGVRWHVLREPITVSTEQIGRFRSRYPHTARPLQNREGRPLLQSRD